VAKGNTWNSNKTKAFLDKNEIRNPEAIKIITLITI
jgi:hypothetical protein